MTPPTPPTPPNGGENGDGVDPGEVEAMDWMRVTGLVNSRQMAALSRQIYHLTNWAIFLSKVDWSKIVMKPGNGGGSETPPPRPPKWPP